ISDGGPVSLRHRSIKHVGDPILRANTCGIEHSLCLKFLSCFFEDYSSALYVHHISTSPDEQLEPEKPLQQEDDEDQRGSRCRSALPSPVVKSDSKNPPDPGDQERVRQITARLVNPKKLPHETAGNEINKGGGKHEQKTKNVIPERFPFSFHVLIVHAGLLLMWPPLIPV